MSTLAREALDALLKSNRLGEHIRTLQNTIDRLWPDWDAAKAESERLWMALGEEDKQAVLDMHTEVSGVGVMVGGRGDVPFTGQVDAHGDEF